MGTSVPLLSRVLACSVFFGSFALPAMADVNPLVAERWQTRPLVVVAPTADARMLQDVQTQLRRTVVQQGFREREMVLYTVVAGNGQRDGTAMTESQTQSLLASLGVAAGSPAQAFLVGKDGGVKWSDRGDRVPLADIFTLIDGMPMRRR